MTVHIILCGKKKIAFIGGTEVILLAKMRIEGFEQARREHSLEIHPEWVFESNFSSDDGFRVL